MQQLKIGAGSIVAVIGEAGLGKSTLIAELKKSNDGFTWLRGDAVSYARSVSYFTWRQIIRHPLRREGTPQRSARKLIMSVIVAHCPEEIFLFWRPCLPWKAMKACRL
jgi:ABC-type cobalamin/Fe3+-siderophores transport system ATPase subunit